MHAPRRWLAVAVTMLLLATVCGGVDDGGDDDRQARRGGTLRLVGEGGVDHLDTAAAYYTVSYTLERTFTRQLVTYPADSDIDRASTLVADAATEVPTEVNGGISEDGMTYTFTIRDDVRWDTDPPRQVTAQDFVG